MTEDNTWLFTIRITKHYTDKKQKIVSLILIIIDFNKQKYVVGLFFFNLYECC